MDIKSLTSEIKSSALALGFHAAGITSVEPFKMDEKRLEVWIDGGSVAGLQYMRDSREMRAKPLQLMPEARSILSLAVSYYNGEFDPLPQGHGRIARYAWGRDYHEVIPPRLDQVVKEAERIAGRGIQARCFTDAVPLLERAAGKRAGIGRAGLNTLLINDRFGSWIFLAEILWDLELTPDPRETRACLSANDCIRKCPTNALVAYRVDAGKCISYHTIENHGVIERSLRKRFGDWLYGCDVCQEVCPHNNRIERTDWTEFQPASGAGQSLSLLEVLDIPDEDHFQSRFAGTPLLRTGRRGLVRNACIVAANIRFEAAVPGISSLAEGDPDPVVRTHAVGALAEFSTQAHRATIEKALKDPADEVQAEAAAILAEAGSSGPTPTSTARD
ncbi:MAG: tRNA epoxyqueuosine(34) reductase QueG [Acidobacteria bacterium]|nr:tRNA epoxyqueuosine(34) reductase QueG [Acidobacteriota bacterium]